MVAIEEILWNIFTYYSLNGNPKDPSRLHMMGLVKFCKDIMAMDNTMTEKALSQAELQLVYAAAIKSPEKHASKLTKEKVDKIDFEGFLSCLLRIAQKCYPSATNKEEAMQQLLMDNILPLATRRKPVTVALLLKQPQIEALFKYYEDALQEIYKFYITSADLRKKGHNMIKSTTHTVDIFDNEVELIEEAKLKAYRELSTSNRMSYVDFIRFANDFGLVTGLGITTLDLGDIYLTVIYFQNFTPSLRRISFAEFWECLVRCALVAFQDKKNLTTEIKIKGIFLAIWRHMQSSVQDHMNGYGTLHGGGFNTYKGALLRGTQLLNDKFIAAWTKDDYHDYLSPLVAPNPTVPLAAVNSPQIPNTLSNLLKPNESTSPSKRTRSRAASAKSDAELDKTSAPSSPSRTETKPSKAEGATTDFDEITRDKLFHIADENVEQSDNFLVKTKNDRIIRIMISDYEEFEDARLNPSDLRKLFYLKPSLAELLYEEMLEAGLVEGEPDEEENEGDDLHNIRLNLEDFEDNTEGADASEFGSPVKRANSLHDHKIGATDPTVSVKGNFIDGEEDDEDENLDAVHNLDEDDL